MSTFAVTYDYRCPFARIAHLHVLDAMAVRPDWEVEFRPFSLRQMHVEEGEPSVWERPDHDSGLLPLMASTVVRDRHPDAFATVHRRLFDLRHVDAQDLREREVVAGAISEAGVDPDDVFEAIDDGSALEVVRASHQDAEASHHVWGVPTFLVGDDAVFVRLMEPPGHDPEAAAGTVERILGMITRWPELNEFKHTRVRR